MPSAGPTALFVSPHLDDVAFSCAGTLAGLKRLGWRVAVVTVFTRSVPNPTGFALACQLDKGLAADLDYMALRRAEDAACGQALGVDELIWLDLPEAPHRGYESAPALFAGVHAADTVADEISDRLETWISNLKPGWIFGPQSIGNHADHRQVVRAIVAARGFHLPVAWYRDLPYASKFPEAQPAPDLPPDLVEVCFPLTAADLDAKIEGSSQYFSQIPFQFGKLAAIRQVLGDFAVAEGSRQGVTGPVEVFRVHATAALEWNLQVKTSSADCDPPAA